MSEFRRRLMMASNNSSDMDMFDIIENNVFAIIPGGTFNGGTSGVQYTIKSGHTYHIIFKIRTLPTTASVVLCVYKGTSNTPNVEIIGYRGQGLPEEQELVREATYTHQIAEDYAYIGVYGTSGYRSATYNCVVYIEDIT